MTAAIACPMLDDVPFDMQPQSQVTHLAAFLGKRHARSCCLTAFACHTCICLPVCRLRWLLAISRIPISLPELLSRHPMHVRIPALDGLTSRSMPFTLVCGVEFLMALVYLLLNSRITRRTPIAMQKGIDRSAHVAMCREALAAPALLIRDTRYSVALSAISSMSIINAFGQ